MKRSLPLWLITSLLFGCAHGSPAPTPPKAADSNEAAHRFMALLEASNFESAQATFAREMSRAMSARKLEQTWKSIQKKSGAFQRERGSRLERKGNYDVVFVDLEFERELMTFKVVIDDDRLVTGLWISPTKPGPEDARVDSTAVAEAIVARFVAGDYAGINASFDANMKALLAPEKIKADWEEVLREHGAFRRRIDTTVEASGPYDVVKVACEFERGELEVRVAVTRKNGEVAGQYLLPRYAPASYAKRDAFAETEVVVGQDPFKLPGTLTMPNGPGPFPAIVLVHGSGPNDRDESIGPNKPFRDLAEGLASRGIAVLRYDKRTKVHKGSCRDCKNFTVKEEAIDDAVAAVALLKATPKIDGRRIFVLGHSLGGLLAPRIAVAEPSVAGLILLAGANRPMDEVIIEQRTYLASLDGKVTDEEQAALDEAREDSKRVRAADFTAESGSVFGVPASYMVDLMRYDAPATARGLSKPILVLQGERDYQVTMADFANWKAALNRNSKAVFKTYPRLNHLFTEGPGAKSTPAEYELAQHIPEYVLTDIVAFVAPR